MEKKIPTYRVKVNEADIESGVNFISLVNDPAISVFEGKSLFVPMNREGKKLYRFETQNKDKQVVAGPFLIPDLPIYRVDEELGEFFIVFGKEEIELLADKFNKEQKLRNINLEHTAQTVPAYVAQNWIIEDGQSDKSTKYGFDLPAGTWFGLVKIEDTNFWQEFVKTGDVKGFSIEGLLGIALKQIKNKMAKEFKVQVNDTWNTFVTEGDQELAAGVAVFYAPQKRLVNGAVVEYSEPVYSGEFLMENGVLITVTNGVIAEVKQLDATQVAQHKQRMKKTEQKFATAKLKDGSSIMTPDEAWKVGSEVYLVKEDGTQGDYAPDGDYELEDGTIVKVAKWLVTEIVAPTAESKDKETKMAIAPEDMDAIKAMIAEALKPLEERIAACEGVMSGDMPAEMKKVKEELSSLQTKLSTLPGGKSILALTDNVKGVKVDNSKPTVEDQVKVVSELAKQLKK